MTKGVKVRSVIGEIRLSPHGGALLLSLPEESIKTLVGYQSRDGHEYFNLALDLDTTLEILDGKRPSARVITMTEE